MSRYLPLLALLASPLAWSADSTAGGEPLSEPEVTIIQRDADSIEEFRVNNQLFMIKVTPRKGYPYYLIDSDGDGQLDTRRNDLDPEVTVPQWVLFRWR